MVGSLALLAGALIATNLAGAVPAPQNSAAPSSSPAATSSGAQASSTVAGGSSSAGASSAGPTSAPASSSGSAGGNASSTSTSYSVQYTLPASIDNGVPRLPTIYDAQAPDPQAKCPGYNLTNPQNTTNGFSATLTLAGPACNVFGNDVDTLNLTVEYQANDRLFVGIVPANIGSDNMTWYILPDQYIKRPASNGSVTNGDLSFAYTNNPTFNFNVTRVSTGDVLFSTSGRKLIYEDQFISFGSDLPENYNLYGLGEVIHGVRLGNNLTRTIFAADAGDPIDGNIYGSHPVYYETRYFDGNTLVSNTSSSSSGNTTSYSHGVYLRNAHPQEVLLRPDGITWNLLGGSLDLYFFSGPTIADVGRSYQRDAIGLPVEQQFWTFGYHQCRWGYQNWTVMQEVLDNFVNAGIPLETLWNDIDYMKSYRDFDNDPVTFPYNDSFITNLLASGRHWVPIVDSAIYIPNPDNASDAYSTYTRGNDSGAFLKNPDGSQYIGAVWPGLTVFPDWLSPGANNWWSNEIVTWHNQIPFSGIWIDMSEVSSFCVGSCGTANKSLLSQNPVHPPFSLPGEPGSIIYQYPEGFNLTNATEASSASSAAAAQLSANAASASASATPTMTGNSSSAVASSTMMSSSSTTDYLRTTPTPGVRDVTFPPYVLNNINGADLGVHAVSTNATHADGTVEYDWHNLFGHQILNATYHGLQAVNSTARPFIIGRSTFAGSGTLAGHWGGDNSALWAYMYFSIPQALSFSLFGIPMFGVDTCGFNGNSDEELCNRWMALSAFFPFYRNHNVLSANSQEPYVWESVTQSSKAAMAIRYSLLNYMYTLFHQAHTNGTFVMRALAWEFPNDPSLANCDTQFFLGPAILVTPVLEQGATTVNGVFPGSSEGVIYYDWYNQSAIAPTSANVTIDAPLSHIPVYVRGGYILPLQEPGMTTNEVRNSSWGVLVALNAEGGAGGYLYIDDGVSVNPSAVKEVQMAATNSSLTATVSGSYMDGNALANVTVLGLQTAPSAVMFGSQNVTTFTYNSTTKALAVTGLESVASAAWAQNWQLTWM